MARGAGDQFPTLWTRLEGVDMALTPTSGTGCSGGDVCAGVSGWVGTGDRGDGVVVSEW